MDLYSWIKLLHILSSTLMFGTGLGAAFFMLRSHLSGNAEAIKITTRNAVLADWLFTTPSVVVQLATGLWLIWQLGIPFDSVWFVLVLLLFVVVGLCWLRIVRIQLRTRQIMDGRERRRQDLHLCIADVIGLWRFKSPGIRLSVASTPATRVPNQIARRRQGQAPLWALSASIHWFR
jgi:uncharacterized membrane protein